MPKNIVIYSDGTGQRGGVFVDEQRSNIYKLFRATRCGPDTSVNPAHQVAFYDPGIGTSPRGAGLLLLLWSKLYNLVCQATGLGLTGNIIDCYAALVRLYRPGDRIFMIGFSRGAYTVRCLGGVIGLCGIPTRGPGGKPLAVDMASSKKMAKEAVKRVYQHTHSRARADATARQKALLEQRSQLAAGFRQKYGSADPTDPALANVYPHFIGVFDTVAALTSYRALGVLFGLGLLAAFALAGLAGWLLSLQADFIASVAITAVLMAGAGFLLSLYSRIRWEVGLVHSRWWWPFHLLDFRMKFYDTTLSSRVGFARHALAIDERRAAFNHVPWELPDAPPERAEWLEQIWFAGCHSDIGGSYPEEESRLSDITLSWMAEAAEQQGLVIDRRQLNLYPDISGPQHDETRKLAFRFSAKIDRDVVVAGLHGTVAERYDHGPVLQYDVYADYRPVRLKEYFDKRKSAALE
jgi:uncharacterized protein (DUF2235 family)